MNKPIIIIDFIINYEIKEIEYDGMLNKAFFNIFSNLIDHINLINLIVRSVDNEPGFMTKIIFKYITNIFSGDISKNIIFLSTFANKETMINGPFFIESIKKDDEFKIITKNEKYWFTMDGKSILSNDNDSLTINSFSQLRELYEIKKQELNIKKYIESIIIYRSEILQIFQNLLLEQDKLKEKEIKINEINANITNIESKINNCQNLINSTQDLDLKMKLLNEDLNSKLNDLFR